MRYALAAVVAVLFAVALHLVHWGFGALLGALLRRRGFRPPYEGLMIKVPRWLEPLLALDELHYGHRFLLTAVVLAVAWGVAVLLE
jgi:hypothetical protein